VKLPYSATSQLYVWFRTDKRLRLSLFPTH
jgi:hypothetical protein